MKGATGIRKNSTYAEVNFNPRTREGCDDDAWFEFEDLTPISIHAPVKGATPGVRGAVAASGGISIHAPVKGATALSAGIPFPIRFQSTHP